MSGRLDAASITAATGGGVHITVYDAIDSTNSEMKRRLQGMGDASVNEVRPGSPVKEAVIASSQTAGRGRVGRTFESPAGAGLYLSLAHSPPHGIESPETITALAAVAVCHAIEKVYAMSASIKWVNDIFMRGRKVAGILTEGVAGGSRFAPRSGADGEKADASVPAVDTAIIGIGVNVLPGALPDALGDVAGAVLEDAGDDPKLNELAAAIISGVYGLLEDKIAARSAMAEYKIRSTLIGQRVTVHPLVGGAASYPAAVVGISDEAGLVVRLDDGTERVLNSGEVSLGSDNAAGRGARYV